MSQSNPHIVHEAESQRQHVRVDLPAKVEINGVIYEADNWSTGGVNIKMSPQQQTEFKEGHVYEAVLVFEMDSFALSVPMSLGARHISAKDAEIGMRFETMSDRQISIMQHLVGAYVTGDLASAGDFINVVSRNNMTNVRKIPQKGELSASERVKGALMRAAVPVLSCLLILYVALSIYEQNYIVSASSAVISAPAMTVSAPASGTVSYSDLAPGSEVVKGEALLSVASASGLINGLDSPCDCIVLEQLKNSGDLVQSAQPVMRLVSKDAAFFIEAKIAYKDATKIAKGTKALIIQDAAGIEMQAEVTNVNVQPGDLSAHIKLKASQPLTSDQLGMPVEVKIDTAGLIH
tara:strand:+ start:996 stop:2042 length:1047 start_codon:yes stop_codon:yes gene_type:complete